MKIETLIEMIEKRGDFIANGTCFDCGEKVAVNVKAADGKIIIEGGAMYEPPERYGYEFKHVFKCDGCFKKDTRIHQKNEIYTRCVGYYRPISQMNPGKLSEVEQREMFTIPIDT